MFRLDAMRGALRRVPVLGAAALLLTGLSGCVVVPARHYGPPPPRVWVPAPPVVVVPPPAYAPRHRHPHDGYHGRHRHDGHPRYGHPHSGRPHGPRHDHY